MVMPDVLPLVAAAVAGAAAMHGCTRATTASSPAPPPPPKPTGGGKGKTVGILHPGSMGASIAFNAKLNGARVVWAGDGRSRESLERATKAGLEDVGTLAAMVEQASVIVSVCPPSAALDVANAVAELKFTGTFVDGNAVAPGAGRPSLSSLQLRTAALLTPTRMHACTDSHRRQGRRFHPRRRREVCRRRHRRRPRLGWQW